MPLVNVKRLTEHLLSDDRRVITRQFVPGDDERIQRVLERVASLSDREVKQLLTRVLRDFGPRHRNIEAVFEENYAEVGAPLAGRENGLSQDRRLLLGAYFTKEYSIEAAALFNPAIVPHPDQDRLSPGALRFIMSLRATGEGHVSSLAFRTGVIGPTGDVTLHRVSRYVQAARKVRDRIYHKHTYFLKLIEMGAYNDVVNVVLERLGEEFVYADLVRAIEEADLSRFDHDLATWTGSRMRWLARSNYQLTFPPDCDTSEVVIYPVTENESRGIEDVRLVRFVDDDGAVMYYGTYTAYNGETILPGLLQTPDFRSFKMTTLNGQQAQNKGAALFPRKVGGWYMMISRADGENLYLMWSSNLTFWNEAEPLQQPKFPWEFVQIGNCGSPLETEEGWLLLTHGVGPMREYCLGATLLDLEDPQRIIAQLREPLLTPNEREREGYVPNVLYTCGALIHNGLLIIPYAMSDSATSFGTVPVADLLAAMQRT